MGSNELNGYNLKEDQTLIVEPKESKTCLKNELMISALIITSILVSAVILNYPDKKISTEKFIKDNPTHPLVIKVKNQLQQLDSIDKKSTNWQQAYDSIRAEYDKSYLEVQNLLPKKEKKFVSAFTKNAF